ncbi:vWA domain-containing protein [Ornithinibacillus californiensis]|uniref:vWA domain-containing protein n=1 Tax=Ornithinibacillus californiensis TaxID=161536 RepID=UPI00064DBABF|nr:VWA domain-containing protein [Ornithinibacillus californiensis]
MNFITPIFFTLIVFIIGVILFYLFRKQYESQIIPSTLLWQQVMQEWQATKWWRKLQNYLLLYLQLLILLFLMLALARPFLGVNELSGEHIVFVLDTSASMTVEEEETTRFDTAKQEALELVEQLDDQQLTVILAEEIPTILFSTETEEQTMKSRIEDVEASFQFADIVKSIQLANQLLSGTSGEIHVFSDSVAKESLDTSYLTNKLVVHNIGMSKNNLSLHTLGVSQNNQQISGILTVFNESDEEKLARITIESNGESIITIQELIEPGKLKQLAINDLPAKSYYKAVLTTEDDYKADNELFSFLGNNTPPTIHLIGDVNSFTSKALHYLSTDVVQYNQDTAVSGDNVIYVLEEIPDTKWPNGPTLVFSPTNGESFPVSPKENLQAEVKTIREDAILRYVDIGEVYIQSSSPFQATELDTILASGETPLISKGYYKGNPLILVGFDIADTDWPLHTSFPIFLYNAINYLNEKQEALGYVKPSESLSINIEAGTTSGVILNENQEKVLDINLDEPTFQAPSHPGLYKMITESDLGRRSEKLFAVSIDAQEKNIQPNTSFSIEGKHENSNTNQEKPNEIWTIFAILALLVLFLEWEVYRRGISN